MDRKTLLFIAAAFVVGILAKDKISKMFTKSATAMLPVIPDVRIQKSQDNADSFYGR